MTGTLLLTKEEVRGLIKMPNVIRAVESAYRAYSSGSVDQPPYMGIHLSTEAAEIDFKAGYHRDGELVSLKASSGGFRDNPDRFGLPNGMGTVLLFDGQNGALTCVMDGSLLVGTIKLRPGEKVCTILTGGNWGLTDLAAVYADADAALVAA